MKVSEVKEKLLILLNPLCIELGYKTNKGRFSINKKQGNVSSSLHFLTNHWFDEVQVIPYVEIDIKEINDIWKKFDEYIGYTYYMNLRELKDWYNIGEISWEKFVKNNGNRYKLFNYENNLIEAFNEIGNLFKDYGLKYIDDFGSIEGVNRLYNENYLDNNNPHCSGFNVKGVVGLIAAKLSDNPNYEVISAYYTDIINQHKKANTMTKKDIEIFFKIKEYLG